MSRPSHRLQRRQGTAAAELTLFNSLFSSIAEEMGACLIRSARSPNIKERRDCSCAVFDGQGRLVAQAAHVPVHLGAMPESVSAALAAGPLERGDAVLLNDPFAGGSHLPDLTLVTPVWTAAVRRPLGYLASRAHHADVGGQTPGSLPLSREIYQEGLRIPPVKLRRRGRLDQAVVDILLANSRTPGERRGDLRAQLAAHDIGQQRIGDAAQRYGPAVLRRRMGDLYAYARETMAALLRSIPRGRYAFEDRLDDDGQGSRPLVIRVAVTVGGGRAVIDFTGTQAACAGNLNAVRAITLSATYYCFLALLVTRASLRGGPVPSLGAGCFEPLRVVTPPGSLVDARLPRAVACGGLETAQRIVDAVLGALAQAVPDLVPAASQGTMNNLTLGGIDPRSGEPFAYYETIGGGMGAGPLADGGSAVQVHMTNTMNTPAEALEFAYPLRVLRYAVRRGSGGRGKRRGGNGVCRDICVLAPATGTLLSDRRRLAPYGLAGGGPGRTGTDARIRDGRRQRLPSKVQLDLQPGDILCVETPGGGGWGKPRASVTDTPAAPRRSKRRRRRRR